MKNFHSLVFLALVFIISFLNACAGTETSHTDRLKQNLTRVDHVLDDYVASGRIAGAVALVMRDGKPLYERAVGWRDREAKKPMEMHTIFRIASQTKAITSAAVLMLAEEKKLSVYDKLSKYLPPFTVTKVAVKPLKSNQVKIEPANRPISLHQLLTHTAGLSYGTQPEIAEFHKAFGVGFALGWPWNLSGIDAPICETIEKLARIPFINQPGASWDYGYSTDVLGCVIERVAQMDLDTFISKRITGPLGMNDTHFFLSASKSARLAVLYGTGKDNKAKRLPVSHLYPYVEGPRRLFSGGAGLVSTVHDYAKFLEMIRCEGVFGETRILKPETVKLMTTVQTGSSIPQSFGYGFEIAEGEGANGMESIGSFGWAGAYGTFYRVDPKQRLVIILMLQLIPNGTDIKEKFWNALYQALEDSQELRK